MLARLRREGFAIWPFDVRTLAVVVEVYPRACTGAVVKSDRMARARLARRALSAALRDVRERAVASEDAFDAAVTALVMAEHSDELASLDPPDDPCGGSRDGSGCPARRCEVPSAP